MNDTSIRFHLDENVAHAVAKGLLQHGVDVTTTSEMHMLGHVDEDQLAHATAEGRVLFTQDRDLLRIAQHFIDHAGIIYCDKNARTVGEIVKRLLAIAKNMPADDMVGMVKFI
ncbi:MAG: DUF5615 family PIN-like protein [Anaerolineae bacterium]|nr:DUF5615 family PIN-like protein [Anaerolineae bacterium]